MNIFLAPHREVLEALNRHQVKFILIGGYAVNYYGYHRMTGDMDLWLAPNNENKLNLIKALRALGFEETGLAEISRWDFEQVQLFSILERPFQVEFMTQITGLVFQSAYEQSVEITIDGLSLRLIQYQDLIKNKRQTGRTKDLLDIEELEQIQRLKEKKKS